MEDGRTRGKEGWETGRKVGIKGVTRAGPEKVEEMVGEVTYKNLQRRNGRAAMYSYINYNNR